MLHSYFLRSGEEVSIDVNLHRYWRVGYFELGLVLQITLLIDICGSHLFAYFETPGENILGSVRLFREVEEVAEVH